MTDNRFYAGYGSIQFYPVRGRNYVNYWSLGDWVFSNISRDWKPLRAGTINAEALLHAIVEPAGLEEPSEIAAGSTTKTMSEALTSGVTPRTIAGTIGEDSARYAAHVLPQNQEAAACNSHASAETGPLYTTSPSVANGGLNRDWNAPQAAVLVERDDSTDPRANFALSKEVYATCSYTFASTSVGDTLFRGENNGTTASAGDDAVTNADIEFSSMSVVSDYTALLSGSYWGGIEVTSRPVIITFSFPTSFPAYSASISGFTAATYASFQPFTSTQQAQALQALGEWAAASGLIFIQVAPGRGDISFMNVDLSTTSYVGAGGVAFYPFGDWNYFSYPYFYGDWSPSGDVFMNSQYLSGGTTNYGTLLHEIGHAIGLKHPTEIVTDFAANPVVVHDQVLSSDDPSQTVMATVGDGSSGGDAHLLPLDQQAAAYIYGPAGTGGVYTTSASGTDSVSHWSWDAATQTLTQTAVAIGETIQGSSVNDIIYGSSGDDQLFGLGGTDVLYGEGGADAFYDGSGNATLIGGADDDSYYVSKLTTTITENLNEGYDAVYSTVSFTLPGNVEALYLYGSGLTGTGNDLDNALFGDGTYATTLIAGGGNDYVVGGAGNDIFKFSTANLSNADAVFGGAGTDTLSMTTAGVVNAGGVSGVENYTLASTGANTLTLTNANFTNVLNAAIAVTGGSAGNTLDASALTATNRIFFTGGAGLDTATGGAGNDIFKFSVANLSNADTVAGGAGTDTLSMTTAGAVNAGGVSGVETYTLASTGANTLTLANANFTNVVNAAITVNGGSAGNTVDASALTGTNRITFTGGAGLDTATGGAGNDIFKFSVANLSNADTVAGGAGADTLSMTTAGAVNAGGVSGVETYTLASTGANTLTLANANFTNVVNAAITVNGGSAGNTVDASALTGTNRITFTGGAGLDTATGGAGNDIFKFSVANLSNADTVAGGAGTDTLSMTTAGAVNAGGVSGVETYTLASTGANTLTLTNANFTNVLGASIAVNGGSAGNTVDASALTGTNRITFTGGAGLDTATGGAGNDIFKFSVANLSNADTVAGGAGTDTLSMTTAGAVNAGGVSGVETYTLASTGANTLTLTNANFTNVVGASIAVNGGSAGNTVDASALTGTNRITFTGGAGLDTATGGAGNDIFKFSVANLSNADTVAGGAGADTLSMTTAGAVNAGGVSGVETYTLASTGANTLTLANANFTNVVNAAITVNGGSAGNTVDASALTGTNRITFTGGAGLDKIVAGAMTTMTGGAGSNQFTFADIGINSITDFAASASNVIVLRDSGFDLGVNEGQGTLGLQHLNANAFVANTTGAFSTTNQRFAYNTANGNLLYDRDGSGSAFAANSVVVLTGHPTLSAGASGQLFFTS